MVFFIHEIYIRRRKQWCLRLIVCHFHVQNTVIIQLCQGKYSFPFYGTFKSLSAFSLHPPTPYLSSSSIMLSFRCCCFSFSSSSSFFSHFPSTTLFFYHLFLIYITFQFFFLLYFFFFVDLILFSNLLLIYILILICKALFFAALGQCIL